MFRALLQSRRVWLVGLLILVKLSFALALSDVFFYGEELEKGTAAKAMLDGLALPHHQLAYHYYEGGGFVISHCAAVAFMLVGQNLLAHKLVALAFQVCVLLAGCCLTRRLFGRRAELWFGLLFIFGPESYQKLSMISLGIHFEACLFLFGILGLGARLVFEPLRRSRDWFWLGLVTGMGLYFSYQTALAAAWVALLLAVCRPLEVFGRGGLYGVLGTLLGAAPLLLMYSLVGDAVFDIHGVVLAGDPDGPPNLELVQAFLHSIFVERSLGERLTPVAWMLTLALCTGALLRNAGHQSQNKEHPPRRRAALYILGYMAFFLVVYLSSGFVVGEVYHYFIVLRLVPLWAFAAILIAGALGTLPRAAARSWRVSACLAGLLLLLLGLRSSVAIVLAGRPTRLADNWQLLVHHKGYNYASYFLKLVPHLRGEREDKLRLLEGFDEDAPGLLRADAVKSLYGVSVIEECGGDVRVAWARARMEFEAVAEGDAARIAQYELGLGALLVMGHDWDRGRAFESAMGVPAGVRQPVLEALGRFGGRGYPSPASIEQSLQKARGKEQVEGYLRGLGRWAYNMQRLDPEGIEALLGSVPDRLARPMRTGFEVERAWNWLP